MPAGIALIALVTTLTATRFAPAADKDKLRKELRYPTVKCMIGFAVNADGVVIGSDSGIDTDEETPDVRAEVDALQNEMTGDDEDAGRYAELSKLYARAKEVGRSKEACTQAIALYRRQAESDPSNGRALTPLGELLVVSDQEDEGEKVLRRALQVAPGEWQGWVTLGQVLGLRAVRVLIGKEAAADSKDLVSSLLRTPSAKLASLRGRELALQLVDEASSCYDRAVALAPREPRPYLARAAGRLLRFLVRRRALHQSDPAVSQFEDWVASMMEALPDLKEVVQLDPTDYRALGMVAFIELTSASAAQKDKLAGPDLPPLPESTRQSLRHMLKKLEKMAQSSDRRVAAGAEEVSGFLLLMGLKKHCAAEAHLRRSLRLNPSPEHAWDLLCAAANGPHATPDGFLAICQDRLKHKNTAKGHLLLAQAYQHSQPKKFEPEVRAALKLEPDYYLANLTLAVLLLERADDAAALAEASQVLARLGKICGKGMSREQWCDCTITWVICEGLKGNVSEAKQVIRCVLYNDPTNERAQSVLDALEK